jgi:putative tricarboxylic transport membrane protein
LKIPYSILFPLVLAFTLIGSYSVNHSLFDLGLLIGFGVLGYLFKKLDVPIAPMAFTLILGPLTEKALRQSMSMSGGEVAILVRSPVAAGLLLVSAVALLVPLLSWLRQCRLAAHRRVGT